MKKILCSLCFLLALSFTCVRNVNAKETDYTDQVKDLVKNLNVGVEADILAAGYEAKVISNESDLQPGDIINADGTIYIYVNSDKVLKAIGVNDFEDADYEFDSSNRFYSYRKEEANYNLPENLECKYGESVETIQLPEGLSWKDAKVIKKLGENEFHLKYTPKNPLKTNAVDDIPVTVNGIVNVLRELPDISVKPITYSPLKTLSKIKLPEGWYWKDDTIVPTADVKYYAVIFNPPEEFYDISGLETTETEVYMNVIITDPELVDEFNYTIGKGWKRSNLPVPSSNTGKLIWKSDKNTIYEEGEYDEVLIYRSNKADEDDVEIPVHITVDPSMTQYSELSSQKAVYGDKLSSVKLPDGWTWASDKALVGEVGINTFRAVFNDGKNTVSKEVKITVNKAKVDIDKNIKPVTTDWKSDLNLESLLPNGWKLNGSQTMFCGTNNYNIIYDLKDRDNYQFDNKDLVATISITINKIDPVYTIPDDVTITEGSRLTGKYLPADDNGKYTWMEEYNVKKSGEYYCTYTPNDTEHYNVINNIPVNVTVEKVKTNESKKNDNDIDFDDVTTDDTNDLDTDDDSTDVVDEDTSDDVQEETPKDKEKDDEDDEVETEDEDKNIVGDIDQDDIVVTKPDTSTKMPENRDVSDIEKTPIVVSPKEDLLALNDTTETTKEKIPYIISDSESTDPDLENLKDYVPEIDKNEKKDENKKASKSVLPYAAGGGLILASLLFLFIRTKIKR